MHTSKTNDITRRAVYILLVLLCAFAALGVPRPALAQQPVVIAAGVVSDATTGLPVVGAYLSATYLYPDVEAEALAGEAWSSADGSYTLSDAGGWGPGQYRFHVAAQGYVPQWLERTWDGATPLALDFTLAPVQIVASGFVTNADSGLPLAGAHVYASRQIYEFESISIDAADTAPDGSFTLLDPFGYGAGEIDFSVYAAGHVFQVFTASWDGATPLELDFVLAPVRTVAAGSVNSSSGAPIAGARVQAFWFDGVNWCPSYAAYSTADGTYALVQPESTILTGAGAYRFDAQAAGYLNASLSSTWDGRTTLALDFSLVPNSPPSASADAYSTPKNTTLRIAAPGVLSNDADVDGDALKAVKVSSPSQGTLTLDPNGSFVYVPRKNWVGSTSFSYRAFDGTLYSNTVTVTITVLASSGGGGRPR